MLSTSILAELSTSPRVLLGPGPSLVHPRVLRAMATPLLGYLDPEFIVIMDETQALLRHAQRHAERQRRLAGADVAAQHDQVAAAQAAAQDLVHRPETGGHGVARDLAGALRVDALHQGLERGPLLQAARGHGL